jgi:hypothetical protein
MIEQTQKHKPKNTASPNISPCVVNPPNRPLPLNAGRNPRQPYAGINDAIITSIISTLKFDHLYLRWKKGQTSEPMIPEVGVRTPTRISAEGCMCKVVFPKRIAVDVIVVKPGERMV